MSYWESRQAREMYEAMEDAEQAAREIADIYAKASRELNYKITQIYERYRDKFELDDDEALKLLNQLRNPWDLDELRQRLEGLKGAEKKEILKELESPAYRARIERLENLQSEIDRMMRDVYNQEKKVSTDHYVDQYNQSYYREIYDLKKRTGLDFSFGYVEDKALNRILRTNWSGANYSQRIWGNTQGLADELKTQLALAYLTGKNESEIASEIAKKYSAGAANARRLVRTESAYISGQAQAAADEEAGLDKYRILATLDLRTSDICREMDGQVFAYKDMEVGVNYPPFHPYCRTTVLSEIDDQDLSQLKRRSRDPVTGEVKTFPGDIAYQKWYEKEVAHNPEALFAEQVEKHRGADLKQYDRYLDVLGKKQVGSIDDFREKKYKKPEEYEDLKADYRKVNGYNNILQSENVITDVVKQVAEKLKIQMAGLDKRIKSKKRYLEKMQRVTKGSRDPKLIKEKIDNVHDVIRYTYLGDEKNLRQVFESAREELEAQGYMFKKVSNTWKDGVKYKGINCTLEAPDGSHTKFELQFHTERSLEVKEKTHQLYEKTQDPGATPEQIFEWNQEQIRLSNTVANPVDVDKIKL